MSVTPPRNVTLPAICIQYCMKIGVIGATGLVGTTFLQVLGESDWQWDELTLLASARSQGKMLRCRDRNYEVQTLLPQALPDDWDIAFLAAGADVSRTIAPTLADGGTLVIDNSNAFRLRPDVPLVVPQVNPQAVRADDKLIANPNCSTIQSVMVLAPLRQAFGLSRVAYTTYQAVSGLGNAGLHDLSADDTQPLQAMPHPIADNIVPQIDRFAPDDYTLEEHKMIDETRKILNSPFLAVTATTVRVPVTVGHCVSIDVTLDTKADVAAVRACLSQAAGVILWDDPQRGLYPMPSLCRGHDEVWVGRIRSDDTLPHSFHLWVAADNLRTGAASNALAIAELYRRRLRSLRT